jgi:hypothetical protein
MNQSDEKTYTELYYKYPLSEGVVWIREIIDQASSMFGGKEKIRLREDAKYFLLLNFAEMIVRPLGARFEPKRLKHDLEHDLKILLDSAAEKANPEISGHAIINALSKNWAELDVMRLDFWG